MIIHYFYFNKSAYTTCINNDYTGKLYDLCAIFSSFIDVISSYTLIYKYACLSSLILTKSSQDIVAIFLEDARKINLNDHIVLKSIGINTG